MPFEISVDGKNHFPVIKLRDMFNGCTAEIYSFGALLNGFYIKGSTESTNVIDGFLSPQDAVENITKGFKSAKLSPFVCRLAKGEYSQENKTYKINKFYLGSEAIHGLLFDTVFAIKEFGTDEHSAFVKLFYEYSKKEEGFPFSFSIEIFYQLKANNELTVKTTVTNTGEKTIPLSDGWHPYFKLGKTIDTLLMQINSGTMLEFDSDLLPSGNFIDYKRFETIQPIGDTFLDNSFVLKNNDAPACIIRDESTGLQLTITCDESYPYLQVYTPEHRNSIAIENLSGAPDAFNNGIGLIMANPTEAYHFTATYQVTLL